MKDKIIISICGGAGTGKTALANEMTVALGKVLACRIPADYYLKSSLGISYDEFISTPFKYDWNLLKEVFSNPIGYDFETPDFDFSKLVRKNRTGGRPCQLRRYVFLDAMLPFPGSDYLIKLTAPENFRMERIKKRDISQNASSLKNWVKMELTLKLLDKENYSFSLNLNGEAKTKDNAHIIVEFLKGKGLVN